MEQVNIATDTRVRVSLERTLLDRLAQDAMVASMGAQRALPEPDALRRQLLGRSVRLTETMAPTAVAAAAETRDAFGLTAPVEIYQSTGRENAAMHLLRAPILMEVQGRLLSLLDEGALRAVIGHEFGHFIAHGPDSPHAHVSALATLLALAEDVPAEIALIASTLSMARELTADRYGLLAARDLDALLRLEMVATTGLPAENLGGDTAGYLAQCRELVEGCLLGGDSAQGVTHPEHGVRAWAAWLFSETDLYRELAGRGPGTRAIADVDALIERVLRRPGLDGSFQYLEPPPVELHELALAASVLVAFADEAMSDEEAEVLEKTFASLVPDWRRLLDPAQASRRVEELAPIAKAWGPSFLRPLFNLLVHVLTADGIVDAREFARVLEIGRLLDGEALFGALMRPLLRRVTVEQREEVGAKPLPVRAQDAAQALDAYLAAIARRGGSQVTLRRLLRMLGETTRDAGVLEKLSTSLDRSGLSTDADLTAVGLDDSIALSSKTVPAAAPSPPPPPDALRRAIQRLRDELISGDGHSPSVRLREVRMGRAFDLSALSRVSVGHADRCLALALDGRRTVLVHGEQTGLSKDAATLLHQLVELRREHLARREETGARDLHLGSGFVRGVVDGYVVRAPLLLHPVELERDGDGGVALVPAADAPAVANQALFRLIHFKVSLPFAEDLSLRLDAIAADAGAGVPALVEHLRQIGMDVFEVDGELHALDPLDDDVPTWKGRRLELEACAVVGLFPQSSSELLHDYEQLLADLDAPQADASALLGCASELLPASLRTARAGASAASYTDSSAPALVIGADPSQVEVVRMASMTAAMVIDGPPGTGKSQVIVNLVADALSRGERVAVVSEKRAALDVVANRLTGIGFGELIGVVHDVVDDRKALFRKIHARLEPNPVESVAPSTIADDPAPLAGMLRSRIAHARRAVAGEPPLGELAAYAAGISTMLPPSMPALAALPAASALRLARIAQACRPWADLLAAGRPWRPAEAATRQSLAGSTPESRAELARTLAHAASTAKAIEILATQQGVDPASSEAQVAALLAGNKALGALQDIDALTTGLLDARDDSCTSLLALRADWMSESDAWQAQPAPVRLIVRPEFEQAVQELLARSASPLRFLSPGWWKARGMLKRQLPTVWPDALGRSIDITLLRDLHRRLRLARLWARFDNVAAETKLGRLLSGDAGQISDALQRVADVAESVRSLRRSRPALESLNAWLPDDANAWRKSVRDRFAAAQAWREHAEASKVAAHIFYCIEPRTSAAELSELHDRFVEHADRVAELDRHLADAAAVDSRGGPTISACADADTPRWADIVLKAWATDRVAAAHDALPEPLRSGQVDDNATERLGDALEAQTMVCRQRVLARANAAPLLRVAAAEKHARRTPEQAAREKLQREVARQRGLMPLRTFVRTYAEHGLFDAVPVWLLSPETLTVLFPRKPVFDVVIFDEASQCTVANGFPAMLRARRAAIAGDDKQMPPTAFFKASRDDAEPDADDQREPADFLESESLLTLARQRMPARRLNWHYRCRDEDLIAFSNHAMYGGSLLTCPASSRPLLSPALRWVAVPDARYEDGRNDIEAERIVDLVGDLLGRPQPPTIGVVTFNLSQRRTVLDALDRRRAADAKFARLYGMAEARVQLDDRPFVKNIESVQGDERDVIVFSLGHAPVERMHKTRGMQRYVPARFGPVGQRGGERRLNVAVSRAREEAIIVASFHPDQLSVARARNDGPRLFKAYLEYVHHLSSGSRTLAAHVLDLVRTTLEGPARTTEDALPGFVPLAGQVTEALLARGVEAAVHVGASRFKVDVALEGETDGRTYRVAILCDDGRADDGAYRRAQRASLLRRRNWRVVHVDSIEWLRDREAVLSRICMAMS